MSPFIPKKYRDGVGLCKNQTAGRILNLFLKRSVALTGLSTNLWSSGLGETNYQSELQF